MLTWENGNCNHILDNIPLKFVNKQHWYFSWLLTPVWTRVSSEKGLNFSWRWTAKGQTSFLKENSGRCCEERGKLTLPQVALRDGGTYGLGGIQKLTLDKGLCDTMSKLVSLWVERWTRVQFRESHPNLNYSCCCCHSWGVLPSHQRLFVFRC